MVEMEIAHNVTCTIDLNIDIGADAVDHKYVPPRFPPFARPVHLPHPVPSPIKSQ
jgi:hypothetical protein